MAKRSTFLQSCTNLIGDRSGNFAMMTAIIVPVVILAAGSAVDFTVANSERTNLQQVADSAVLAGGAVFDGSNLSAATAVAEHYIKGQLEGATDEQGTEDEALTNKVKYKVTASENTLKVSMKKAVPTSLMKLATIDSVNVGVTATALSPMKPEKITFTPTKAQGFWFKKISVLVLRKGATSEVTLGTVVYQPTTQNDSGQGTFVAKPSGTIDLGKYTNLALRMDIKKDGCDIGYKATVTTDSKKKVTCTPNTGASYKTYNSVLRTDDPATSNYLFVDSKQVPVGVKASLEKYFGCSKTQEHAWEDGGGWERQDFFYTVTATCAPDGTFVRLVK